MPDQDGALVKFPLQPGEGDGQGRQRYLRETAKASILLSVGQGAQHTEAAEAAGIARSTFYLWMKEDPDFAKAVTKAEMHCVSMVKSANYANALKPEGHRDRRLFLAMRGHYVQRQEVSGPAGGPIAMQHETTDPGDLTDYNDHELTELENAIDDGRGE